LRFLLARPERVHSRTQLLDHVWGDHVYIEERTVDVHIRRLRQALEPYGQDGLVETVRGYCRPLREADVDTVILGCTHYPLVRPMLQRMLGPGVGLVTSGAALARQVGHALAGRGLAHPGEADREGDYRFLTTGDVESFRALGTRFLQMPLGEIEHVDLAAGVPA